MGGVAEAQPFRARSANAFASVSLISMNFPQEFARNQVIEEPAEELLSID